MESHIPVKKKIFATNLLFALTAQGVSYLTSALTSLVVPKLLGVEQFGYWQLFLLYASYAGIADLGIGEGVYLRYGGCLRDQVDRKTLSVQYKIYASLQAIFAVVLFAFAFQVESHDRAFVVGCTSIYLLIVNLSSYMYYLMQAINETKKFSTAIIFSKIAFVVALVPMLLFKVSSFKLYLIMYDIAQIFALIYCIICCKDLIFCSCHLDSYGFNEVINSSRVGYKLLIANLTSTLLVGILRMMVDSRWDIKTFGQLSLAITLCNFFMQCVYQFSMVLFPALRQLDDGGRGSFYKAAQTVLNTILPIIFIAYYPIAMFIHYWLPEYNSVVYYFAMLLPLCIFDGRMDILGNTFLKVIRKETLLMIINVSSVLVGTTALAIAIFVFGSINCAIWILVAVVFLRCFVTELYVSRQLCIRNHIRLWTSLFVSMIFVISSSWGISLISLCVTAIANLLAIAVNIEDFKAAFKFIRS